MMEPIAIVGAACRFPGESDSLSKLWELLRDPVDVRKEFPAERLNLSRFYREDGEHHGSTNVRGKSYLLPENYQYFDSAFFNISPKEAEGMDPQQRMLLEVVYESMEAAGLSIEGMSGSQTSVHVGVMSADYNNIQLRDTEVLPTYNATGTSLSILANRISYFFNLRGPSITIDTACSSSLVALHQAIQGIRSGDATSAIVAGTNLILDPYMFIAESSLHMLSPESLSRMWDKSADGYARGEGFAAIILKPLSRAIMDGDNIDAIIRGTGINSDGRTKGITMPSSSAQAALIRETYKNAGLSPTRDRCQYFECHGTGTEAGDPIEAQAIYDAFFPHDESELQSMDEKSDQLLVGSVKTVIGHLEGCAGLAGVLKVVLAMKNRTIPPNMHFSEPNSKIAPLMKRLRIATAATPWPSTQAQPMRASVNSFGFGGTNAHAIIESYANSTQLWHESPKTSTLNDTFVGPLVFSANSSASLVSNIRRTAALIREDRSISIEDLTWTLQFRRSLMQIKHFFSGATVERLLHFMDRFVTEFEENPKSSPGTRSHFSKTSTESPGILGIFTGQGAQWASMGSALILESHVFRSTIERCQIALDFLPDAPCWNLKEELMKGSDATRIGEAEISQPLCTALQIATVDLLFYSGIKFDAVVGHSSGEIAAVYAAGIIDASAAMQIAYYRGYHAHLACGSMGETGQMLAVGISYNDALAFCNGRSGHGKISVAAHNSPLSVTLSGDSGAIMEAKEHFDKQKTFARILKTDTAYHSHHMEHCAGPYLESLKACNIKVQNPRPDCTWISSVRGDVELLSNGIEILQAEYWVQNMCRPVLFAPAVESSIWHGGPFDVAVEVGPHPALKGPVEQTIKSVYGEVPGYAGAMRRGDSELEAMSGCIGYIWSQLGSDWVDFDAYRRAFDKSAVVQPHLLKSLPAYSWDHEKAYWKESRISKNYRLRRDKGHELLGRRVPDDVDDQMRWRNVIRLSELQWLEGHVFQGQVLFPGAGYVIMALEAARMIADGKPVTLFEVEDVSLSQAIVVHEQASTETTFTVKITSSIRGLKDEETVTAEFACYFGSADGSGSLAKACTGRVIIHYGSSDAHALPLGAPEPPYLVPVERAQFYDAMKNVGLDYQGLFRGMKDARRHEDTACTQAVWPSSSQSEYIMHPAHLDVIFQSLYVAFASPSSGEIWAPYLPTHIKRISLNPNITYQSGENIHMDATSFVTHSSTAELKGDTHVRALGSQNTSLQIEGLSMKCMSEPQPENDKRLFARSIWLPDVTSTFTQISRDEEDNLALVEALDRSSLFYWRKLLESVADEEIESFQPHFRCMIDAIRASLSVIERGQHPIAKKEWLHDTLENVSEISQPYRERVDMRLIEAVGNSLESVVRGEEQLLEVMVQDDMLNRFYMEGYGFSNVNASISQFMKQLVQKYPHLRILEVGAGTGGTTRSILDEIGDCHASYTYTDISPAFFQDAAEKFSDMKRKMTFKVLDAEKDIQSQGFEEQSYDVVIAANVLHATKTLSSTMDRIRSLMRPGGYLVMMEVTGPQILRTQFIMGGLPGWWYGVDDGRILSPAISLTDWNVLLQRTGFSGVDHTFTDMADMRKHSFSLIVSQATNETVDILRDPLSLSLGSASPLGSQVLLVGGQSDDRVSPIAMEVLRALKTREQCVMTCNDIENAPARCLEQITSVICLQELEQPIFSSAVTETRLKSLQRLFSSARNIVWATDSKSDQSAHSYMILGMGRAMVHEIPGLQINFVDLSAESPPAQVSETLLKQLIRMNTLSTREDNILWTNETETRLLDGTQHICRVLPSDGLNESYNASRRQILKTYSPDQTSVEIRLMDGKLQFVHGRTGLIEPNRTALKKVKVQFSVFLSTMHQSPLYLCGGAVNGLDETAIAVSSSNASVIEVSEDEMIGLKCSQKLSPEMLQDIRINLLVKALANATLTTSETILLYEPEHCLVEGARKAMPSIIFASSGSHPIAEDWVELHERETSRTLQDKLPQDLGCIFEYSQSLPSNLRECLPEDCETRELRLNQVTRCDLQDAYSKYVDSSAASIEVALVTARRIVAENIPLQSCVVDWTDFEDIDLPLAPPTTQGLFTPSGTYLLAGMTGALGVSLTQWMISNGARHVVMTSRNPGVEESWLKNMRRLGATVRVVKNDISDRNSVYQLVEDIKKDMPQIAGVCNASMVLNDQLFTEMSLKNLNATLVPKVEGTKILDEVFHDIPLDFFVLFSSLASIIGNVGQSNYHAANMFMSGLIEKRRERGHAGSIMHIGLVTDAGYVARQGKSMEDRLRKLFFSPLSTRDIQHAFATAIRVGRSDKLGDQELILGLEQFEDLPDAKRRPPWEKIPRFAHYVKKPHLSEKQEQSISGSVNIAEALKTAGSVDDAAMLVQQAFTQKLESMMQLAAGSVSLNIPLIDLGCDSLLAIEIRRWFLQELGIDVPVLTVLSGDTAKQICYNAVKKSQALVIAGSEGVAKRDTNIGVKDFATKKTESVAEESQKAESVFQSSHGDDDNSSDDVFRGTSTPAAWSSPEQRAFTPDTGIHTPVSSGDDLLVQKLAHERKIARSGRASLAQSRLWFQTEFLDDKTTYNVTVRYDFHGKLDLKRLEEALDTTICHHPSLQTCFRYNDESNALMQSVMVPASSSIRTISSATEAEVQEEYQHWKNYTWDLSIGDVFAATILALSPEHHIIVFGYHHIVMDGVSWHLFLRDLNSAYQLHLLAPGAKTYLDYTEEQFSAADSGSFAEDLSFWREQHRTPMVAPLLPTALTAERQPLKQYESTTAKLELDKSTSRQIKEASRALHVTPFHFHLAAVQCLLAQLLDQTKLCIGVADANRTAVDYYETVGFFLNLLPVVFDVDSSQAFGKLAQTVKQQMFAALSHSQAPFDLILDSVKAPRSPGTTPLFQISFNYRMGSMLQVPLGSGNMELTAADDARNPYDIGFNITDLGSESYVLEVNTQTQLYPRETTDRLLECYANVLKVASNNSKTVVAELKSPASGLHGNMSIVHGPRKDFGWPETLSERVDNMCSLYSDKAAIKCDSQCFTYAQLSSRVRQVSQLLKSSGVTSGNSVAVFCQPSIDSVVCMLAILRQGYVYVPLDTRLPNSRLTVILEDCQPHTVLCHGRTLQTTREPDFKACVVKNIDTDLPVVGTKDPIEASPVKPAFLFYTSGTTGKPKGIVMTQRNFANHIALKTEFFSIGRESVLQQSSFGFDMAVIQIFCALANGGTLVVAPKSVRGDPVELSNLMAKEQITFTIATPSEYSMLMRYGSSNLEPLESWGNACMGGEVVTEQLLRQFEDLGRKLTKRPKLTNCYGPTETTAALTFQRIALGTPHKRLEVSNESIVGQTLCNGSTYIVDENDLLVPVGTPGEICVGGAGVALGYLNLSQQTNAKFVENRLASAADVGKGWNKMYKTGDRGRLLEDGTLVLMGRTGGDNQVKLRGLRVDLDEVSSAIIQAAPDKISEAIVTMRGDSDSAFLVAHVLLKCPGELDECDRKDIFKSFGLAEYMWPAIMVTLESLPININGKVDRKQLSMEPLPAQGKHADNKSHMPISLAEGELRLLWDRVLGEINGQNRLSPDSDFFVAGGNSMLLVRLQAAIKESMGVSVPLIQLYEAPTLGQMATLLSRRKEEQQRGAKLIDWEAETTLPSSFSALTKLNGTEGKRRKKQLQVAMTGFEGFMGGAILDRLVKDPSIDTIHCIAAEVKPRNGRSFENLGKTVMYEGSLTQDNIGLSDSQINTLRENVDIIIHAGAKGHCLNNYTSLRASNVHATRFLIGLALPRRVPIHFISSNRVTLLSGQTSYPSVSVSSFLPKPDGSDGFTASKWASEQLLEQASAKLGLTVRIHRSCAVIGEEAPNEDALNALLKYSRLSKSVPQFSNFEGFFDFQDVNVVAEAMRQSILTKEDTNRARLLHIHHSSGQRVPIDDLRVHLVSIFGGTFADVSVGDWIARATELGIDPLITGYLEAMTQKGETIRFPYLGA